MGPAAHLRRPRPRPRPRSSAAATARARSASFLPELPPPRLTIITTRAAQPSVATQVATARLGFLSFPSLEVGGLFSLASSLCLQAVSWAESITYLAVYPHQSTCPFKRLPSPGSARVIKLLDPHVVFYLHLSVPGCFLLAPRWFSSEKLYPSSSAHRHLSYHWTPSSVSRE